MSNGDVRKGPATVPKSPVLPVADPTPVAREMLDDPVLEGVKVKDVLVKDVLVQFSSPQYFVLEGEGAVEVRGLALPLPLAIFDCGVDIVLFENDC